MRKKKSKPSRAVREKKQTKKTPVSVTPAFVSKIVSAPELAAYLNDPPFSNHWVRDLANSGYLVKVGHGRYDLAKSFHGYARYIREKEVKAVETEVTSRAAFEAERARKLKLENDTAEAKLIDTQLAIGAIDAVVGVYQTEMHSIPPRMTNDVALRRQWEIEIDRVSDGINARCERAVANLAAGRDPLEDTAEDDAG